LFNKEKIKLVLLYLIANLILAQIGFNVFSLSCYCKKEVSFSILPKKDDCHGSNNEDKGCCSVKKCAAKPHKNEQPCGKSKTEYKTAHILASNKSQKGQDKIFFITLPQVLTLITFLHYPIQYWPIPPVKYFVSGNQRRLLMSSLTC